MHLRHSRPIPPAIRRSQALNHQLQIDGHVYRLRPITRADAGLIVELRGDVGRSRYLHPIALTISAQEAYLDDYLTRGNDYYFVVEALASGRAEGLIALYNVDASAGTAEIGRWILRPGSAAGVESVFLMYRIAFEVLHLREVYCRTIADNRRAVSFHDSCGLARRPTPALNVAGQAHECVEHFLSVDHWPAVRDRLERLARMVA